MNSAQTHDLRTSLVGQLARAFSVFCIDEVVVFTDGDARVLRASAKVNPILDAQPDYTGSADPDHFLIHLLAYLETPPHLRKLLFPIHPNLRTAGTLPSLDLPHHLRADEWCIYREGVSLDSGGDGSQLVEAGLRSPVEVEADIPPHTRVTLRFDPETESTIKARTETKISGEAVPPDQPREDSGYYWGYHVRKAKSLSDVFTEAPYDGGYDITIGTSERGYPLEELHGSNTAESMHEKVVGHFRHLLIVFGGVSGLEVAFKNDSKLQELNVTDVKDVFDHWIDLCPGQGSRTIRTEEAVWMGLMGLRRLVVANYQ